MTHRHVPAASRRLLLSLLAGFAVSMSANTPTAAQTSAQTPTQTPTGTAAAAPVRGGLLQVAVAPEPTTLTSAFITTMNIGMVSSKVLEGLVAYDLNLNPVPVLATSWTLAPDGKTITFKLRPGVKWHDGKDFSAADVKFTLEKVWKELHPFGRAAYANVERVDTPDALTVVIRLSAPSPYILNYVNTYGSQILPKHLYEGTDILANPYNNKPVGTGPFVFKEWVKGSHVRLERNPAYWGKGAGGEAQPYLDGVIFKFIPDAAARTVALEAGELDVALGSIIPATSLSRFADKSKWTLNEDDGRFLASIFLTQFNVRKAPLNDKRLRQALLHAIDRDALLKIVYLGHGKVATGPVPSSVVNYYSDDVRKYPFDVKRAEALLDEAGYKRGADGKRLQLTLDFGAGSGQEQRAAELLKQQLGKVGVELELRTSDTASYLKRIFTDADYDLTITSLHRLPDPTLGVQRLYWTKNIKKGSPWTNGSGYSNPELDKVMESAADEPDLAKRKALIKQWQQIVQEDLPILELIEPTWITVQTARLQKPLRQGDGLFASYADAWLQPRK